MILTCVFVPAVLPESTVKETSLGAETFPSTTEVSAEEDATSAPATGSLPERPKTSESSKAPAPVAAVAEPVAEPTPAPTETADAAHTKRPYEKPIFSNDEVKPTKMAKTEEEEKQAAAAATTDKQSLAGAGPASTAAYTAPEPVPATSVISEAPKVEEKKTEPAPKPVAAQPSSPSTANPDAVAAANAAINTSKADKTAAAEPELKKPEAAVKREETKAEAPQTENTSAQEPAKETKAEESKTAEQTAEQAEKKKGGFFARLKRMFK